MSSRIEANGLLGAGRRNLAARATRRAALARWLSLGVIAAGGGLVMLYLFQAGFFSAFVAKPDLPVEKVAMPEQVTGSAAKIAGVDKENQPFVVVAASGFQDLENKDLVHLAETTANLQRKSGTTIKAEADNAHYESKTKRLDLDGNVVVSEGVRFEARMAKGHMNLETKAFESDAPVHVTTGQAIINADSMVVSEDGKTIQFQGRVKFHLEAAAQKGDGQ